MKKINATAIVIALVVCLCLGLVGLGGMIGYRRGVTSCPECPQVSTDTTITVDSTITGGTAERPEADSLISVDSTPFAVPYSFNIPGDAVHDTVHDTVVFYLPYEHRIYSPFMPQ